MDKGTVKEYSKKREKGIAKTNGSHPQRDQGTTKYQPEEDLEKRTRKVCIEVHACEDGRNPRKDQGTRKVHAAKYDQDEGNNHAAMDNVHGTDNKTPREYDTESHEKHSQKEVVASMPPASCIDRDSRTRRNSRLLEMSSATGSSSSTTSSASTEGYSGARPRLPSCLRVRKEVACSDSEQIQKLTHARRSGVVLMMKTQSHSIDVALLGSDRRSSSGDKRRSRDHSREFRQDHGNDTSHQTRKQISKEIQDRTQCEANDHRIQSSGNGQKPQTLEQSNQNRETRRVKFSSSQPALASGMSLDMSANEGLMRPRSQSLAEGFDDNAPRLVFVGDQYVGKTALITRFTQGLFNRGQQSHQMASKVIKYSKSVFHKRLGRQVRVQFWDIDGGETKTAIRSSQKAHAVVVLYDLTNRSSFDRAKLFLESINPRVTSMLVGNKVDIRDLRRVSYEEGRILAKIHRVQYVETSVKYNHNIEETLQLLLACIPREYLVIGKTPYVKQRSRSDSTYPTPTDMAHFCDNCQNKLFHHHPKDEIGI